MTRTASKGSDPSCSDATIASARAYHVLKIDGYSRTINISCRPSFESCLFYAGGHTWKLRYYPMGSRIGNHSFISLYLSLVDPVDEAVTVKTTFSLLDQDQKPVRSYRHTATVTFSAPGLKGYERFIRRKELERSEHLKDDCFAVRVDVRIVKEAPSTVVPLSDMHRHLGDLLWSKEHTDVEFRVSGETFAAHRLLLGARSPVFKAELFGPIKEGTTTDVIQIDDMEAHVFRALLTFVYTDAWPEMEHEQEPAMSQHLLIASDRYGMQRLKLICEEKLCNHIDTSCVATILALAEKHNCLALKEACFDVLGSSATLLTVLKTKEFECLALTYPTITKELISNVLTRNLKKVKVLKTEEFERLALTWPTITKELVSDVLTRHLEKAKNLGWNQERQSVIKPST
ncbi:BTB/POZ and MATH domain-containing protein 1-like [Phragmites australis]|uniref:BTB/POZ and MATH domain-containing protein 1-like n=1 Tax=Phragmites australis TaxID=29695 RepID=UPI002D79B2BF|nr:BTB/POZ and MATH domain-containing protein 1-like [Phragmites australis]